jgi:hypothetical protein
LTPI